MRAEFYAIQNPRPDWGNCQAEGAPDTRGSGDLRTAWASKTQDGQREWLIADYGESLSVRSIEVHETFNPGAVDKITGVDAIGMETTLWQGLDPAPVGAKRSVSVFTFQTQKKFSRFKVYIDSPRIKGWNEIDAIGVTTKSGTTKWAKKVSSSSSFGNYSNSTRMW